MVRFVPITPEHIAELRTWHYPPPYDVYDYKRDPNLDDPIFAASTMFAALKEDGSLIGELTVFFEDETMWIGLGLHPALVGRGLGQGYLQAALQFACEYYQYPGQWAYLAVAAFNQRAIRVYQACGFQEVERFEAAFGDENVEYIKMRKEIHPA